MNRIVEKSHETDVLGQYPIKGPIQGWYFRLEETSNCAWTAEGTDLWGRKVSCQGHDEDLVLSKCLELAAQVQQEILAAKKAGSGEA